MTVEIRTDRWKENLAHPLGTMLVVETDAGIVAWSGFGRTRDDSATDQRGEVYGFYVAPTHWRTGVGSLMWGETCEQLRAHGFEEAELWVLEPNGSARHFYESMGCSIVTGDVQPFEIGGTSIPEVKYSWEP